MMEAIVMRIPVVGVSALLFFAFGLSSACSNRGATGRRHAFGKDAQHTALLDRDVIPVVDQNNRTVMVPKHIERVAMIPLPVPALYYAVTGDTSKIAGFAAEAKSNMRRSMLGAMAPELLKTPTDFVKGKDINIEELLRIKPDVVFFWGLYPKQVELLERVHIPAVAIYTMKGGNALQTIHCWIRMLGRIFGEGEKSAELIQDSQRTADMVYSRIQGIPRNKKPRALLIASHSSREIGVPGKGVYIQYWLEATGAVNAAEDVKGTAVINMEQIYKWDPDIIYLSNFCNLYPPDLINNAIDRQDWSKLRAVREQRVYKIPSGIYRWCPPSADAALMLKWLAKIHHPQLFGDYDMKEEVRRHFADFYRYNLAPEQIENILHPVRLQ
jgi:iron complex transport system substrate-binding protein